MAQQVLAELVVAEVVELVTTLSHKAELAVALGF
jgi:hypothetical protein